MRSSILPLSIVATLTTLASAEGPSCQHKSDITKQPSGNPIATPGSTSEVPVGVPYDITWQNTTAGPVSLVLLRGPSTNAVDFLCIVDSIPNSGSYSWTPPTSLDNDVSHYGIKIVVDATGDYQYSTQFGIVNDNAGSSSSSSSSKGTAPGSTTPAAAAGSQPTTTTTANMRSTQQVYQTHTATVPCSSSGSGSHHQCNNSNNNDNDNNPTTTNTNTHTQPPTSKPPSLSFTGTGPARANSTASSSRGATGATPSKGLTMMMMPTAGTAGMVGSAGMMPTAGTAAVGSTGYSSSGSGSTEPSPTKPITKPTTLGVKTSAQNTRTSLVIQTGALSSSSSGQGAVPTTRAPPAGQTGRSSGRVGVGRGVVVGLVGLVGVVVVVG